MLIELVPEGKSVFCCGENNQIPKKTVSWGKGIRRQTGYYAFENDITLGLSVIDEKGIQGI